MQTLWTLLHSERKYSDRLLSVDRDLYRMEESGMTGDFTIIRTVDWINVIPVTAEGNFVFIRQFRHGIREVTLEIPGGAIDASDPSPRAAAERELREETGFVAGRWEDLGFVTPNPALQNNRCHTFLAIGSTRGFVPRFDAYERIETVLLSRRETAGVLRDGTVHHGLVLAAFGRYFAAGYDLP
jgi:ADP-ribose pyrophosphatase